MLLGLDFVKYAGSSCFAGGLTLQTRKVWGKKMAYTVFFFFFLLHKMEQV